MALLVSRLRPLLDSLRDRRQGRSDPSSDPSPPDRPGRPANLRLIRVHQRRRPKKADPSERKFAAYCEPRKNVTFLRHQFFTRAQAPGESFDHFLLDLRHKAKHCEFSGLHDSLLRDRIVAGVNNDSLRVRLLRDTNLDLKSAIETCRAAEASVTELHALHVHRPPTESATIHSLSRSTATPQTRYTAGMPTSAQPWRSSARPPVSAVPRPPRPVSTAHPCDRCGFLQHPASGICPARGHYCGSCGKKNHFASVCRSQPTSAPAQPFHRRPTSGSTQVNLIQTHEPPSPVPFGFTQPQSPPPSSPDLFIGTLSNNAAPLAEAWTATLTIAEHPLPVHLDTGAQCNVLSSATLRSLPISAPLQQTSTRLVAFGGQHIRPIGVVTLPCLSRNLPCSIPFHILAQGVPPTLGLRTIVDLDLIRRVDTIQPPLLTPATSSLAKSSGTARFPTYLAQSSATARFPTRPNSDHRSLLPDPHFLSPLPHRSTAALPLRTEPFLPQKEKKTKKIANYSHQPSTDSIT